MKLLDADMYEHLVGVGDPCSVRTFPRDPFTDCACPPVSTTELVSHTTNMQGYSTWIKTICHNLPCQSKITLIAYTKYREFFFTGRKIGGQYFFFGVISPSKMLFETCLTYWLLVLVFFTWKGLVILKKAFHYCFAID